MFVMCASLAKSKSCRNTDFEGYFILKVSIFSICVCFTGKSENLAEKPLFEGKLWQFAKASCHSFQNSYFPVAIFSFLKSIFCF